MGCTLPSSTLVGALNDCPKTGSFPIPHNLQTTRQAMHWKWSKQISCRPIFYLWNWRRVLIAQARSTALCSSCQRCKCWRCASMPSPRLTRMPGHVQNLFSTPWAIPQFPIPCPALSSFLFLCAVRVLPNEMAGTGLHSVPCMLGSVLGVLGRHSLRTSANQGHCKRRGMPWTAVPAPPIQEGRVCDQQATRGKCFCHSSIARCTPRFKSAASHRPPGPTAGSTCSLPLY